MEEFLPLQPSRTYDEKHFSCPTCRDEGIAARVLAVDRPANLATVLADGGEREVFVDLLDDVSAGDFVLVHLDMAIAKLNPADVVEE